MIFDALDTVLQSFRKSAISDEQIYLIKISIQKSSVITNTKGRFSDNNHELIKQIDNLKTMRLLQKPNYWK